MIFISAGHNPNGKNPDPGAVAHGVREADLTIELRDLIEIELAKLKAKFITDRDNEPLVEYLNRIKPGDGSVVFEIHFNAAESYKATGVETVVPASASAHEIQFAQELSAAVNRHTGLQLRGDKGVIREGKTKRGRLAIMREEGMNALLEVCFITNISDLNRYRKAKQAIAKDIAAVLVKYDAIIK